MEFYNRKIYLTALILSMIAVVLLVVGFVVYGISGRTGLVPLIILSVSATLLAVSGIVLLCFDLKIKK